MDVLVNGDVLNVTGKFFTHVVATDPNSAVNPKPAGTLTYAGGLAALGLQGSGSAGMIFDVGANTSKASFTNFSITGTLASSGTDPLPGRLTVIKHVINDNPEPHRVQLHDQRTGVLRGAGIPVRRDPEAGSIA